MADECEDYGVAAFKCKTLKLKLTKEETDSGADEILAHATDTQFLTHKVKGITISNNCYSSSVVIYILGVLEFPNETFPYHITSAIIK